MNQKQDQKQNQEDKNQVKQDNQLEETSQNAGARTAATNQNPQISLEEGRNAAAGQGPNAAGSTAPSEVEEYVPGTSDPEASDLPSSR